MKLKRLFHILLAVSCMFLVTCASTNKPGKGGKGKSKGSSDSSTTATESGKSKSSEGESSEYSDWSENDSGSDSEGGSYDDDYYYHSDAGQDGKYSSNDQIDSLIKDIEKSRRGAEEAGADMELPDLYNAANGLFDRLKKRAASGEVSEELRRALENLNSLFKGLEAYTRAKEKKQRIDDNDYAKNNQKAYDDGASLIEELEDINKKSSSFIEDIEKGKSDKGNDFLKKAVKAGGNFDNVFKSAATNERNAAFKAKKQADSVKASVSRKNDYDNGVGAFRDGDARYTNGDIEGSIEDYVTAKGIFSKLYKEVSASRQKAQSLINGAKEDIKRSEGVAVKADKSNPLTARIDGIEDEKTVLLEADDFSYAKSTYVDIKEKIDVSGGKSL